MTPHIVITILLTIFPCYSLHPHDYFITTNLMIDYINNVPPGGWKKLNRTKAAIDLKQKQKQKKISHSY